MGTSVVAELEEGVATEDGSSRWCTSSHLAMAMLEDGAGAGAQGSCQAEWRAGEWAVGEVVWQQEPGRRGRRLAGASRKGRGGAAARKRARVDREGR